MQEILWLTKNRTNRALSTVAFFAVPVSRNDAGLVSSILSVIEIPVCVVCVDLFLGLKAKSPLARTLACFWCPEEARSRRRDPGIRSTGCPSSPVVKQAVALLSVLKRKGQLALALLIWCPEEDSNLHTLRHTDLNRARLPIPPSGQAMFLAEDAHFIVKGKFVNEKEK